MSLTNLYEQERSKKQVELAIVKKYIGKNQNIPDDEFNQKELKMGIKVEMEHTDNKMIAKEIAKDHLMELDDYYTQLAKIEPHHFDDEDNKGE